jgi:soluble lytic murein transglycosylase-like protein
VSVLLAMLGLLLVAQVVFSQASARQSTAPIRYLLGILLVIYAAASAHAACAAEANPGNTPQIRIPNSSAQDRIRLEREAGAVFGLDAPVARFAAQIHKESGWRPDAASIYAQGLAQFTPATATWLPDVCPSIGPPDAWDASWSIRALVCYDHYLETRVDGATDCDRWSFVLSAYNGGLGWVNRDRNRASGKGLDPARWFDHVETQSGRAEWARLENRDYVRRILLTLEPAYIDAGWTGAVACP